MPDIPAVIKIVERCQALFDDLDFNAVKEWKAAAPGRKAIDAWWSTRVYPHIRKPLSLISIRLPA